MITPNKANPLKASSTVMRFNGADNDISFFILNLFAIFFGVALPFLRNALRKIIL
jgi:hypothetical protein